MIAGAVMVPHPPLIVPEVGRGGEKQIAGTTAAYRQAARFVIGLKPDTVILTTPHSVMYQDYFHISPGTAARGDLGRFGAGQVRMQVAYDQSLARAICLRAAREGFPAGTEGERDAALDHATMVPLYLLREAAGGDIPFQLLRVGLSGLPFATHYRLGQMMAQEAGRLGRRVAFVASGDLSHYLKSDGPYGLRPEGAQYDERLMDIMGRAAFDELLTMDDRLCERAGECGQRSFLIMAGALDGLRVRANALSYESVTGVGYGICTFLPEGEDAGRRFLNGEAEDNLSAHVRLARQSYEYYVKTGKRMPRPEGLPDWLLKERAGCFVTLHKFGELRGCIGTIAPTQPCLADEIIHNAVSAAARDPRFPAVRAGELDDIDCSVDVLAAPEDIADESLLDVKEYGVIVTRGGRRGLLLPNLDGVDTVADQVAIARHKAGIGPDEPVSLQRFKVTRYH